MMTSAVKKKSPPGTDWSLELVLSATRGALVNQGANFRSFSGVSTDTRTLARGDLFVALNGEKFVGATFAPLAIAKGAFGIIVNQSDLPLSLPLGTACAIISVEDTLQALGDLAACRRRLMPDLKVIGITGSSGKTTVKEMTAAILSDHFQLIKTEGNFNNLIGLPLSLLPVTPQHQVAVLEMGTNSPGEIARLAKIAAPDISCIVNIQEAHLEGLQDINGVAAAKMELFDNSSPSSTLVVNLDDPLISSRASSFNQRQISYTVSTSAARPEATIRLSHLTGSADQGSRLTLHIGNLKKEVQLRTIGRHNATNALAAAAIAHSMGLTLDQICTGLEKFAPYEKRSQVTVLDSGIRVINDCYNANPSSMQAALETLQRCKGKHHAAAALGDMLELGGRSGDLHHELGRRAAASGLDFLGVIGAFSSAVVDAARAAGMEEKAARSFDSHGDLADWFARLINSGRLGDEDWLLIKGSRGMAMEKILAALQD